MMKDLRYKIVCTIMHVLVDAPKLFFASTLGGGPEISHGEISLFDKVYTKQTHPYF